MYLLVTNTIFNVVIFCLIIGNTITLALNDYPQSDQKELRLEYCNVFFTWVFFVEMTMKMGGFGIKNYARDKFNLFDACVVVLSLVDWTISKSLSEQDIGAAGDALQAFRAMRLLRVIKLARLWKELQLILTKTLKSLRDISSFSILLILFMYIYALLGMELFANRIFVDTSGNLVKDPPAQFRVNGMLDLSPPRENFDDILAAMTTIFIIIVGDDWQNVMYNGARLSGKSVAIYVISCMVIGNIILLSLFTAILLQNFEEKEDEKERNLI